MSTSTITKKELQRIVTESVRETLSSELMKLRALALPSVSKKEQRDIEQSLRHAARSLGAKVRVSL